MNDLIAILIGVVCTLAVNLLFVVGYQREKLTDIKARLSRGR